MLNLSHIFNSCLVCEWLARIYTLIKNTEIKPIPTNDMSQINITQNPWSLSESRSLFWDCSIFLFTLIGYRNSICSIRVKLCSWSHYGTLFTWLDKYRVFFHTSNCKSVSSHYSYRARTICQLNPLSTTFNLKQTVFLLNFSAFLQIKIRLDIYNMWIIMICQHEILYNCWLM